MTHKEWLLELPTEECADTIRWLVNDYSRNYSDGRLAIIEWLQREVADSE